MKNICSLKTCSLMLFVLFTTGICFAQHTFNISGTVSDDKGTLPGATVFLTGTKFMMALTSTAIKKVELYVNTGGGRYHDNGDKLKTGL